MELLKAESAKYEIERKIGEGLTSEVYKAFRLDSRGETRHAVALKILKSKNHVHVFRQEFERLIKINSLHCVKLLGWENLKAGPALVLEYLEGLTLYEVACKASLSPGLVDEVIAQVQQGLQSLHQASVVHGDLNCKNIFITKQGIVKLLDFGWSSKANETMATPQFMAPELWSGEPKSEASDQFSLGLIYKDMIAQNLFTEKTNEAWEKRSREVFGQNKLLAKNPQERQWIGRKSDLNRRKKLSKLICKHLEKTAASTRVLHLKPAPIPIHWKRKVIAAAILLLSFYPQLEAGDTEAYKLSLRSDEWLKVSVNGLPSRFAPFTFKNLRPGKYKLEWKTRRDKGFKELAVDKDSLFLLQLEDILLR